VACRCAEVGFGELAARCKDEISARAFMEDGHGCVHLVCARRTRTTTSVHEDGNYYVRSRQNSTTWA
jgi:hypothetical protein